MKAARPAAAGRISRARLWAVAAGALTWAALVVHTLYDLQVRRTHDMRDLARRQQEQIIPVDPRRGTILDRVGRELAVSTDAYSIYAVRAEMQDPDGAAAVLARALELGADQVRARLSEDGFVLVRRRVAPDVADRVRAMDLGGVHLVAESKRFYPRGSLAAHVLGFVVLDQPDLREGLEQRYDAEIRGTPGALLALRDARGGRFLVEERRGAVRGHDLVTSLDEVIQHIAERELAAAVDETGSRSGMVVVLYTPTGEVLALANHPTFNPNRYGAASAADRRNRAVTDFYEPGSTFKIVTAAAALEEGLVRPSEIIDCQQGLIVVAGVPIHDHKSFGLLSFAEVLSESSNVGTMKVGMRLDVRDFHDSIARFGFGARTGVDLPGESRGLLRPASKWAATSEAYISFGQEIGATALQIASAFSTVANRGIVMPPRVVTRIIEGEGRRVREMERPRSVRAVSEATADILIELLENAVNEGTGRLAAVPGYRVAGKTGTAQKIVEGLYAADRHVASFAGFVPSRRPVLTVLIVLDEPRGMLFHGGDVAAPVFRRIAEPALRYLGVPEDAPSAESVVLASLTGGSEGEAKAAAGPVRTAPIRAVADRGARPAPAAKAKASDAEPSVHPVAPRPLPSGDGSGAGRGGAVGAPEALLEPLVVPDLAGAPLRDAVVGLARLGLAASVAGDGFVVTQDPKAGAVVEPGAVVALTLGRFVSEAPEATAISPTASGGPGKAAASFTPERRDGAGTQKVAMRRGAGRRRPPRP